MIGENDPWAATYDEARTALTEAGIRSRLTKVPRVGHAIPPSRVLEDALRWCLDEGTED
jgi:hypothetical protein